MSLAELYMTSPELAPDSLQARLLLREAARRGFAPAAERLWLMIEKETEQLIGQAALDEARQYYDDAIFAVATPLLMKAVASEEPYALALLAECYAMGWGVPYDYDHAMHLFWYAARLGDPSAQYIVGETLQQFPDAFKFEEEESASDPQAAARTPEEWLQAAAAQGIPDATAAIERLTPAIMHK